MIIIDSNHLCYINFFGMSEGLSYKGNSTGIIFGFLRHVLELAETFHDTNIIFCWDSKESLRKKIYPDYKANRRENLTEEQKEENQIAYSQFNKLRELDLPFMGFNNNFHAEGYESDDIIAQIVIDNVETPIVVTNDKDMLQLLDNCYMYNISKKEHYTKELFIREYGIRPKRWVNVKALAGCSTDNVKGIDKVGELTAIKYLKGELKPASKAYQKIITFDSALTRKLIELPFEGCPDFKSQIKENSLTEEKFKSIFEACGFESFLKNFDRWKKAFSL
jgi:DNA polymerase I